MTALYEFSLWNEAPETIPEGAEWLYDEPFWRTNSLVEVQRKLKEFIFYRKMNGMVDPVIIVKRRTVTYGEWEDMSSADNGEISSQEEQG